MNYANVYYYQLRYTEYSVPAASLFVIELYTPGPLSWVALIFLAIGMVPGYPAPGVC
jgi:hypothetical protein